MQQVECKYNREKVASWTGLKDEELTEFIVYCDLKPNYILESTEYDIMEIVKNKLLEFKKSHNLDQTED